MDDQKLLHNKPGQIQIMQPQNSLLEKSEVIVGYLQQMALPSMFNRELSTEDYRLWDQVLGTYSITAIKFAFDTWVTGGRKFPIPADVTPLCISYHEQEEAARNPKLPSRDGRMDGGHAQMLVLWNMVLDRIATFKEAERAYEPISENEIPAMLAKSKSGTYVPKVNSNRYFPNGNAKYNRELTQARVLQNR
jgi:hypothetical protein